MVRRLFICMIGIATFGILFIPLSPQEAILDSASFRHEEGHAFVVVPAALKLSLPSDDVDESQVVVHEDGRPLAFPHASHDDIREIGGGRYSHWQQALWLSTSDNSDPRTNGRTYVAYGPRTRIADWLLADATGSYKAIGIGLFVLGPLLVLLPWSPLTHGDRQLRRAWWRLRTLPFVFICTALALLGWVLIWNGLNITMPIVRLAYAGLLVLMVILFFGNLFMNWRSNKRHDFSTKLPWYSQLLPGVTTAVLSLLIVVMGAECAARVIPVFDSMAVNPGARYFWPEFWEPPNSLGFTDREPGPKRGPRVLILGDSYTEGAGVRRSERYADRLQVLLRRNHPQLEVFAAARCGYDTGDEADLLQRMGDQLEPDVVIVGYVLNDAERGSQAQFGAPSPFFTFMTQELQSYLIYRLQIMPRSSGSDQWWTTIHQQHEPDSPGWRRVEQSLDRIAAWCDQRGVRRMLVVFPIFVDQAEVYKNVMEGVVRGARQRGFKTHNFLGDFAGRGADFALSAYDGHPGPNGHEVIARRLATLLDDWWQSPGTADVGNP